MNERFRFLKYDEPGNKFAAHCDGVYSKSHWEATTITIQYYLNEGMKGGATTFFHDKFEKGKFECVPKIGRIVFFRHNRWLHEGSELIDGLKYTIRNDFLYKWYPEQKIKTFKSEKCLKCGKNTEMVQLSSCEHKLIMCRCSPYNYYCTAPNSYAGKCIYCGYGVKLPPELEALTKSYKLNSV